jgi:hypothetical protein
VGDAFELRLRLCGLHCAPPGQPQSTALLPRLFADTAIVRCYCILRTVEAAVAQQVDAAVAQRRPPLPTAKPEGGVAQSKLEDGAAGGACAAASLGGASPRVVAVSVARVAPRRVLIGHDAASNLPRHRAQRRRALLRPPRADGPTMAARLRSRCYDGERHELAKP